MTEMLSNADALSFIALDEHYGKDRDRVFFCDWHIEGQSIFTLGKKETITEVAGALPKTFVSLGFMYAKDSLHAYFKGNRIRVKHLATFRALDLDFSADTLQAYFNLRPIIGSDGATFQMVDECFAKDKKFVYFSFYDQDSNEEFSRL